MQHGCVRDPVSSHLRGDVVWSATECLGGHPIPDVFFAHAKISNLDVAL